MNVLFYTVAQIKNRDDYHRFAEQDEWHSLTELKDHDQADRRVPRQPSSQWRTMRANLRRAARALEQRGLLECRMELRPFPGGHADRHGRIEMVSKLVVRLTWDGVAVAKREYYSGNPQGGPLGRTAG